MGFPLLEKVFAQLKIDFNELRLSAIKKVQWVPFIVIFVCSVMIKICEDLQFVKSIKNSQTLGFFSTNRVKFLSIKSSE